jgi:hypothetical protein
MMAAGNPKIQSRDLLGQWSVNTPSLHQTKLMRAIQKGNQNRPRPGVTDTGTRKRSKDIHTGGTGK